jgi:hypothetical protein
VLQLASPTDGFLLDMLVLGADSDAALQEGVSRLLTPLLAPPSPLKLGYALHGDLRKLAGDFPRVIQYSLTIIDSMSYTTEWTKVGVTYRHNTARGPLRILHSLLPHK